jgi:hypothetical protein
VSRDNRTVAWTGGSRHQVLLWDLPTGRLRDTFNGHRAFVSALAESPDGKTLASASYDGIVYLWDLTKLPALPAPDQELTRERFRQLWDDLGSKEPANAYPALHELLTAADGVKLIAEQLRPAPAAPLAKIRELVADLDHNEFDRREAASRELARLGASIEDELRRVLRDKPPAETRRRVEELLDQVTAQARELSADDRRQLRAVRLLEQNGSEEAVRLLRKLAAGGDGAPLTRAAKLALQRLSPPR